MASKESFISLKEKKNLETSIFAAIRGLDALQELIDDESITEIMVNGTEDIFYERAGSLRRHNAHFETKEKLDDVVQKIAAGSNRVINESNPIVDARLADGSRVNMVLAPIALNGPIITIRKFPKEIMTINKLIEYGSLTEEAAEFLKKLVIAGYNIFVSGANRIIGLSQMTFRKQRVQTT